MGMFTTAINSYNNDMLGSQSEENDKLFLKKLKGFVNGADYEFYKKYRCLPPSLGGNDIYHNNILNVCEFKESEAGVLLTLDLERIREEAKNGKQSSFTIPFSPIINTLFKYATSKSPSFYVFDGYYALSNTMFFEKNLYFKNGEKLTDEVKRKMIYSKLFMEMDDYSYQEEDFKDFLKKYKR